MPHSAVPAAPRADASPSVAARILIALVRAYQLLLSPLLGGACRYEPSCSAYAVDALTMHGAMRGAWFAARRFARCHPFGGWGIDPVPSRRHSQN